MLMLSIHPQNPQLRLVNGVADAIVQGGVVVMPTDSGYSLCCGLAQKQAIERIRQIRRLDDKHFFTLFCRDFAEVSIYAQINNQAFRFLKAHTPAAITFILHATAEVPRRLLHPRRRTVGVRISQNLIMSAVLNALNAPVMSVSVDNVVKSWPLLEPTEIFAYYGKRVELVVDGGAMIVEPTTVVNLTSGIPEVLRQGSYALD